MQIHVKNTGSGESPKDTYQNPMNFKPTWQSSRRIAQIFWAVAGPYWKGEDWKAAVGLLALVLGGVVGRVLTVVGLNSTNGKFFNSLQEKNQTHFYENFMFVALLLCVQLSMVVLHTFSSQMLEIRWRKWLTNQYSQRWLANEAFYRMRFQGRVDNPDQRISEDIKLMISHTLELLVGFLNTALTVIAFAGVLYSLSGTLYLTIFGIRVGISGYLFWTSMVYWALGAALGYVIGNPLIWLNNRQQRFEADFRFALMRVREKAEAIALYEGQVTEATRTRQIFDAVNMNSIAVLFRSTKLLTYQTFMIDAPSPLSFILCAPRFFSGAIPLGDMMRSANGFGQLSVSMSWLVSAYPVFADWHATVDRMEEFRRDLEEIRLEEPTFQRTVSRDAAIHLTNVMGNLPDGTRVFSNLSLSLKPGAAVLITGKSGTGKSTLFRILAGIWTFGSGELAFPATYRSLMLPQQPYIPIGTLRNALWFPAQGDPGRDQEIYAALASVELSHLSERLDEYEHWEQILSVGEQQRLAIAQALLFKPDWLFMDEATSGLDETQEGEMYAKLGSLLPDTTLVSIGHRATIEPYHQRTITLEKENAR